MSREPSSCPGGQGHDGPSEVWPGLVVALAAVVLGPVLARVLWVPGEEKASDARSVLWFVTVAAVLALAGASSTGRAWTLLVVSVAGSAAAIGTLGWWWSAQDQSGLFVVGLLLATPPVAIATPLLLLCGRRARRRFQRGGWCPRG